MKILILNFTRFGDLLQTQPLLSGLADKEYRVGMACLEHFFGATALLKDVEYFSAFPDADLLRNLDKDWAVAVLRLQDWKKKIFAEFKPDIILNLTATLSNRLLASFLGQELEQLERQFGEQLSGQQLGQSKIKILGYSLDEFGFSINSNRWATYLQASTQKRLCSPYNLVDLYRKIADVADIAPKYELSVPVKELGQFEKLEYPEQFEQSKQLEQFKQESFELLFRQKKLIAFQLGASEQKRRWPSVFFAELADKLWFEFGFVPVILGSKSEENLLEGFARKTKAPYINMLGKTSLSELALLLKKVGLLVSNDTGTMHLAAGLNVPVLAIFLATAQAFDTAPYQVDMCCLEPDLDCHPCAFGTACEYEQKCRYAISADLVFALLKNKIEQGCWLQLEITEWLIQKRIEQGYEKVIDSLSENYFHLRFSLKNNAKLLEQALFILNNPVRIWQTIRSDICINSGDCTKLSDCTNPNDCTKSNDYTKLNRDIKQDSCTVPVSISSFLDVSSLSGHEFSDRTQWYRLQRYVFGSFLDNLQEKDQVAPTFFYLSPLSFGVLSAELEQADSLLHLLGEQGRALLCSPVQILKNRFLGTCQRVQSLWDSSSYLNGLGYLWLCELQSHGDDFKQVLDLIVSYHKLVVEFRALLRKCSD